jgi:YD repeat-containing protein
MEYDAAGQPTATTDARTNRSEVTYDALGRVVEVRDAEGHVTTRGYCADVASSCATCGAGSTPDAGCEETIDPLGHTTRTDYDAKGRVINEIDGAGGLTH